MQHFPQAVHTFAPVPLRLVAALLCALISMSAYAQPATIGQPAADFALRALHGSNTRLSEHAGEVVLMNFWATWCGPCRQQMPMLESLHERYRRAGLVVLGVNLDDRSHRAAEMAATLGVSYPVLWDEHKHVSRSYAIGDLPATLLIDRNGIVRDIQLNYKPTQNEHLAEQVRALLNE